MNDNIRWIPYIGDTDVINKSWKGLLKVAMDKLNKKVVNIYGDSLGMQAFEIDEYIVVAKAYPMGYVVSVDKDIVYLSKRKGKNILMFLNEPNQAFYIFVPDEIIEHGTENLRGDNMMINFDLRLGKRYE